MNAVFADTSYFAALLSADDVHHRMARSWSEAYQGRLVVTESVLIELGAFFSRRKHRRLFLALVDDLATDPQTLIVARPQERIWSDAIVRAGRTENEPRRIPCGLTTNRIFSHSFIVK